MLPSDLTPPRIPLVSADGKPRPFWSVMIPTYNPRPDYLEETLRSVLSQAPGPEQMQIEVVDDASPSGAPVELVRRIAGDRVAIHCESKNNGLAGTWNRCIERARGECVHILHQDDLLMPGFYEALRKGFDGDASVGAAFCRSVVTDQDGHWSRLTDLERRSPGILDNWQQRLGISQLILTPSIVVRRSTYEALGGFLRGLPYTVDWEMWLRITTGFSFWFEPQVLACYRTHNGSETARLVMNAEDARDIRRMIQLTASYFPPEHRSSISCQAGAKYANLAIVNARRLLVLGQPASACKQLKEAFQLSKRPQTFWWAASLFFLGARISGSRLKRMVKCQGWSV